jgi:hypothetical protein
LEEIVKCQLDRKMQEYEAATQHLRRAISTSHASYFAGAMTSSVAANVAGFFSVLAEWSRAEIPSPASDTGKPDTSEHGEVHHDR